MRSSSSAPWVTLTSVDRSLRPCYLLSSCIRLLILGSTIPYRGTQVVTLVMPLRYPQPILFLRIRLDNSRYFSNLSRSHTSSISSLLRQCRYGLGIHQLGFHKGRRSSPFTFYIFKPHNSPLTFCKDAVRNGYSDCVRTRDESFSPHHHFDSSDISTQISNSSSTLSELRLPEQTTKTKHQKNLKK